jgi:hypothetical protein
MVPFLDPSGGPCNPLKQRIGCGAGRLESAEASAGAWPLWPKLPPLVVHLDKDFLLIRFSL